MITPKFRAINNRTKNKLSIIDIDRFNEYLMTLKEDVVIVVEPYKEKEFRSNEQLKLYWACIRLIAEEMGGEGYNKEYCDQLHYYYKLQVMPEVSTIRIKKKINGEIVFIEKTVLRPKSLSAMKQETRKEEMTRLIEHVMREMAELGIEIPELWDLK